MSVMQQKLAKVIAENPFYRMSATFSAMNLLGKADDKTTQAVVDQLLFNAWTECNKDKEKKELFFSLVFSVGDVQNREHNLFRRAGIKTPDGGGSSKRKAFLYCLNWILKNIPQQFYAFLPIIGEYYNLDGLFFYELTTDRWKGTLTQVIHLPINVDLVTEHIAKVLTSSRTTDNEKMLWARWLPHIPNGTSRTRKYVINEKNIKAFQKGGHGDVKVGDVVKVQKPKKSHTIEKDKWVFNFISLLSDKMDWKVKDHKSNKEFVGYKAFKTKYLANTEAVMFSTQRIVSMDKTELLEWFDQLPNGARDRTKRRLLERTKSGTVLARSKWKTEKGLNIGEIFMEWMKSKEVAQQALRNLTPEEKKELAPKELKQMEKAARVNTGGENMLGLLAKLANNTITKGEANLAADTLLNKMKLEVPVLVVSDRSGSMASNSCTVEGVSIPATRICQLLTTIFLLKNPDEDLGGFFMTFGSGANVITDGQTAEAGGVNRYMRGINETVIDLIDRKRPFVDNLLSVGKFIHNRDGSTNVRAIAENLKVWVNQEPDLKGMRIDMINKYPVFLIISDGDFNNAGNGKESLRLFMMDMLHLAGWNGVVVVLDINERDRGNAFEGMENVIHLSGANPSELNRVFTNISDVDIIDTFIALKTLHSSNRYEPVRKLVL